MQSAKWAFLAWEPGISYNDKLHVFHSETEVGPVTQKLYKELTGVQTGDIEAPVGWIVKV